MRYERSKSSMFLLEILINILLFSILCVCSLQFFIKSYQLTENTTTLHHAVTACNNVAAIFQSSDNSVDTIKEVYPNAIEEKGLIYIYFDENYQECDSQKVAYYMTVSEQITEIPSVKISFYKNGADASYSMDVYRYQAQTLLDAHVMVNTSESTSDESEVSINE